MNPKKIRFTLAHVSAAMILALVPFHAFLTVWLSSFGLSYTALRLWSAGLLLILIGCVAMWFVQDKALRVWAAQSYLIQLVALFVVINVVMGLRGLTLGTVSSEAFWLGLLLNLRYITFFVALLVLAKYSRWPLNKYLRIVMISAVIVSAFAVLQYTALPADFLRHFGYSTATIEPMETINNNPEYIRVASTLRGANPLGAYMVVIIAIIVAFWRRLQRKTLWGMVLALSTGALVFSFSRSAWLGLIVAVLFEIALHIKGRKEWLRAGGAAGIAVVLLGGLLLAFHTNSAVQNALYHTDDNSTVATSSNDKRSSALMSGLRDVIHEPLGRGTGSAGPASVHNTKSPARLAENYYLQLGQELGWVGLITYLALSVVVGSELWRRREDPLARGLLTAFVGLIVVNMLSHAWTDDTLAFTWWGLAGLVIGQSLWQKKQKKNS